MRRNMSRAELALWGLVWVAGAGACKAPKPKVPAPHRAPTPINLPRTLQEFQFVESFRGPPSKVGCSDGQREGLADFRRFPNIAGCLGRWQGKKKLRAPKAGPACGDDAGPCVAPADLCASGWHLCAHDGNAADLSARMSAQDCNEHAGPGRFVAGMSHGQTPEICPPSPTPHTRFPCMERGICSEPVCCGDGCEFGGCRDAVWRGATKISRVSPSGCGAAQSKEYGGVLCCRDELVAALDSAGMTKPEPPPKPVPSSGAKQAPGMPAVGASPKQPAGMPAEGAGAKQPAGPKQAPGMPAVGASPKQSPGKPALGASPKQPAGSKQSSGKSASGAAPKALPAEQGNAGPKPPAGPGVASVKPGDAGPKPKSPPSSASGPKQAPRGQSGARSGVPGIVAPPVER